MTTAPAGLSDFLQQREILHISRSNLENVRILGH